MDIPDIDVVMTIEQFDGLGDMSQHAHDFAARFTAVIYDPRHRRFVAEGVDADCTMPAFDRLLPELDLMTRITTMFNPRAGRPDIRCDSFVNVPMRTAVGFCYVFLQASRVAQATLDVTRGTDYVAYHRRRVDMHAGYRGPSAVAQWKRFYPSIIDAGGVAGMLMRSLEVAAPAVARALPQPLAYVRQPLPPVAMGARVTATPRPHLH